ncbi:DUF3473 domain-containing protein [Patescibacteria group bacterium]|nr:DUF3473 domain-containing protein [Patescibacteria group bacterium]
MDAPVFEIHLENFNHALHIDARYHKSDIWFLFDILDKYHVKPIVYRLGIWREENRDDCAKIRERGYVLKSHGIHHYYDEDAERSPYWNQEGLPFPPSGGFFFRLMPLCYLKWAIKKSGVFWIHPHDLDETHPKLKNPFMNWKRHVGLKGARKKLERLLKEVRFRSLP